jgi:hypothetical protein
MIGLNPKVEIPAKDIANYYTLETEEKTKFKQDVGREIGVPFWPLFVERVEPEEKFVKGLGIFGRIKDENPLAEDIEDLIIPMPREEACKQFPHLEPCDEECQKYEKFAATEREIICSNAITAIYCPIDKNDDYKTSVYITKAQFEINSCAVCMSPATAVGAYQHEYPENQEETKENKIILHGLCKHCNPGELKVKEKIEKVKEALTRLIREEKIMDISSYDQSSHE